MPEYRLGLMLFLERACDYLDEVDDLGIVFGDYEKDEVGNSVVDFSEYKTSGKTPMFLGRPLGRLVDTVYFTHSHHSRFLQLADVVVYMAGRYLMRPEAPKNWHDAAVFQSWQRVTASADFKTQYWP